MNRFSCLKLIHFNRSKCFQINRSTRFFGTLSKNNNNKLRSKLFVPCLDKAPRDDEAKLKSHKFLLQAGYMRRVAAGIYSSLPLLNVVTENVVGVIDEELQRIDCQRTTMPSLMPASLWQRTGRWNTAGAELWRLQDRRDAQFCLGPTHEEVFSSIVADAIEHRSANLPLRLYQISTKFRDEIRPRFGLMRGREFLMKDLYTFDESEETAMATYESVSAAYTRIFDRIGLHGHYCAARADTGNIGGDYSHEFHVLSDVGEDELLECDKCGEIANSERAESVSNNDALPSSSKVTSRQYYALSAEQTPSDCNDASIVEFLWPDHRALNESVLVRRLQAVEGFEACEQLLPVGAKHTSSTPSRIMADTSLQNSLLLKEHLPQQQQANVLFESLVMAQKNDIHRCGDGKLKSRRGIEIGQAFLLGEKYSKAFEIHNSKQEFVQMGCYGLGVSRIVAALTEVHSDPYGIRWPLSIAPFGATVVMANNSAEVSQIADSLSERLNGVLDSPVLLDDRHNTNLKKKINEAVLIGSPYVFVVGRNAVNEARVDFIDRFKTGNQAQSVAIDDIAAVLP